jgi:hypothetical protein
MFELARMRQHNTLSGLAGSYLWGQGEVKDEAAVPPTLSPHWESASVSLKAHTQDLAIPSSFAEGLHRMHPRISRLT